jgi:hypothetical protein
VKRLAWLIPLLSLTVVALPSGRKWALSPCTTTCTGSGMNNVACTLGRCLPEVRFASSVGNGGGMTINGPSAVSYATALTAMRAGFEVWTTPNVASCSTSLMFAFQPDFATPVGTAAITGSDGNNGVIWLGGTSWRYGSGTLGLTTTTFSSGRILDADMELNNNSRWGNTGGAGDTDIQSVVAHEAGHFIGLGHTTTSNAVMNPSIGSGLLKRTLFAADLSDVCSVYPGTQGGQGSACTMSSMCTGALVCEGATGSSALLCTQDCTAVGQSCPAGYTCQGSTAGFACLPEIGVVDQCRFCVNGADCSTGICLTSPTGFNFCSQSCTTGSADQCGAGSSCADNGMGTFCLPDTTCTNQCTAATVAADCAPGYACQGGRCTPTGATGDRCEASRWCQGCNVCVEDGANPGQAFCRACCSNAGQCASCTATTCAPVGGLPSACMTVPTAAEQVCFPVPAASLCEACDANTPCSGGNVCVGGACHTGCDPQNPGNCAACLARGAGAICACPNEISAVNEPCSATAPLGICRTGLVCLSGLCRSRCMMGSPGTCPSGATCTDLAGQTVCIPGAPPMGGGGGTAAGGGTATGGGTGGGSAEVCGPSTCGGGCCIGGQCAQSSDQTCGTFGGACTACGEAEACELGACVPRPKKGCGCSSVEGSAVVLLALARFLRRRREKH